MVDSAKWVVPTVRSFPALELLMDVASLPHWAGVDRQSNCSSIVAGMNE